MKKHTMSYEELHEQIGTAMHKKQTVPKQFKKSQSHSYNQDVVMLAMKKLK